MAVSMRSATVRASGRVQARPAARTVKATASLQKVAQVAGVAVSSLALAFAAGADATVKLGADSGALVFDPATVTIKAGESVSWVNNAGYPHNIVFDEDSIPGGENADALSHEDYLNAPGETVSSKFATAGTYEYYCEPHQGAGMKGKVVVN
uniref:Plastocyanin n=1 Tax=Pseudopediastrum boryanum TaxID=55410 RepID=Q9ST31_PSEBY|nr:pre-apoplastocyanin [Pseudopediastrum boryanum]BAE00063.1 plastocyanin precursor [Pseudopediastrum boryanum]